MGVAFSHPPGEIHDIVFSRARGPFDERDHLVLQLLVPHLDAALRRLAFPAVRLTPRETEVLRCVRDGMSTRLIAKELGVAECTVVKHLEHIYGRIGAHSRAQALQLCSTALS
jgi:DNA-binding CsgD family transcriptional regulator